MKKNSTLRLDWPLDPAGYRIDERAEKPLSSEQSYLSGLARQCTGTFIVGKSGVAKEYELGSDGRELASLQLANMPQEKEAALAFANRWGLPTREPEAEVSEFYGVQIKLWGLCYAYHMKYPQFSLPPHYRPRIHGGVARDASGVERVPEDLEAFCWYELVDLLSDMGASSRFKLCDYCRGFYIPKPRAGSKSRFCNHNRDSCRHAFHANGKQTPAGHTGARVALPVSI